MYCHKCGSEINRDDKFCIKCGFLISSEKTIDKPAISEDKWYLRLAKVVYIISYIPLPFVIFGVWISNHPRSYYDSYTHEYTIYGSYGEAFWYSVLALVAWIVILRLIKIAVLFIFTAQKPKWEMEFRKFF